MTSLWYLWAHFERSLSRINECSSVPKFSMLMIYLSDTFTTDMDVRWLYRNAAMFSSRPCVQTTLSLLVPKPQRKRRRCRQQKSDARRWCLDGRLRKTLLQHQVYTYTRSNEPLISARRNERFGRHHLTLFIGSIRQSNHVSSMWLLLLYYANSWRKPFDQRRIIINNNKICVDQERSSHVS